MLVIRGQAVLAVHGVLALLKIDFLENRKFFCKVLGIYFCLCLDVLLISCISNCTNFKPEDLSIELINQSL